MTLNVKLVVVGGDVKTTELTLRLPSTIGRGRGTSVILPHPLVSRQHCELYEADGQLMVRDLGSLNGTFVNNQRITDSLLAPGELLTVGTVTFRAVYEIEGALSPSQASTLKGPSGEKTVHATKATTRAAPKSSVKKPAAPPPDDSGPLEFDFGKPLFSEEPADAGGPAHVTERLELDKSGDKSSKSGGKKSSKPAAEKSPAAEKPPAKGSQPSKNKDDAAEKKPPSASDDDLNDFLESLGE
jgi:pSer/pThr/pTyr-binding forkhead associated (FHA) protein